VLDHGLTAFGDMYHDYNKTPRFFMMMFGNVSDRSRHRWVIVLHKGVEDEDWQRKREREEEEDSGIENEKS
jgi:tripartite-type tricarboxylate transporter receptor subunit TctC